MRNSGIVFYGEHSNDGGTFTDADGTAGTVRTLTNARFVRGDWFQVGALPTLRLTVSGTMGVGPGIASAVIILEGRHVDPDNAALFNRPHVIGTVRLDTPAVAAAASQTIAAADLVGEDVQDGVGGANATETLDVVLLTTDATAATHCRVLVKAGAASTAGDKVVISAVGL